MITTETAAKLKELGFPLVSVGREDHAYAADFCRFCGFPFLKVGDTYYLMPVINAILAIFGKLDIHLEHYSGTYLGDMWFAKATEGDVTYSQVHHVDPDESLCLLWIKLKEAQEI